MQVPALARANGNEHPDQRAGRDYSGLGDAFSLWFKSNVRNYELLRYTAAHAGSRRGD
jgi:hypothetical protein